MKYKVDCIKNYNEEEYKNFYDKIKKEKQNRIKKYINKDAKKRSILGEQLLIELLKEENINYKNIEIKTNENGKPFIKNQKIYYSISHSYDYVISVISNKPIGIDIEKIRKTSLNTIKKISKEKKEITSERELFQIYTLKEAYLKMKGLSLIDINNVEFKIEKNIICSDSKVIAKLIYDIPGYIIAICEDA